MDKKQFFVQMMLENIHAGFVRGQEVFAEGLNEDLEKTKILESVQLEGVVDYLMQDFQVRNGGGN